MRVAFLIRLILRAWAAWPMQAGLTFGHGEQSIQEASNPI